MTSPLTDELRRTIIGLRKTLGLSQRRMGAAMVPPVSPDTIHAFEQSAGNLMVATAERMLAAQGFKLTFTLEWVGKEDDESAHG